MIALCQFIEYDDGDFDPRELYPMVLRVLDADDDDPDQYLKYLNDPAR